MMLHMPQFGDFDQIEQMKDSNYFKITDVHEAKLSQKRRNPQSFKQCLGYGNGNRHEEFYRKHYYEALDLVTKFM